MPSPVVDFHMHPGPRWCPIERRLHELPVKENFQLIIDAMDAAGTEQAVCMLLDEDWFRTDACEDLFRVLKVEGWDRRLHLCGMFDVFRIYETEDVLEYVDRAAHLGMKGVKVHPNLQRVRPEDMAHLKPLAERANRHGLFVIVHVYGYHPECSTNMGIEIAAALAPELKVPLIIAHGGGLDLPKAVALAKQYPNIMLDLSYFLELAEEPGVDPVPLVRFAIEELGPRRILYGSDHPSCNAADYRRRFEAMFRDFGLSESDIEAMMGGNALRIFEQAKALAQTAS